MQQTEPSREVLLSEIDALRREIDELKRENADLEMLIEMNTEHSDHLEEDLLKRVESALRESEKRFRLIIETIPVPLLITRLADSTAVYVNEHMCSLIGLPDEKLLGHRSVDFLYEDPGDRQHLLDTLAKQGYLNNYELRGKRSDGTPFWVALFIRPLTFNDEACMLSALYDLTEHKQAEEEIRRLNEKLEQRVKRREGKYLIFTLANEDYGISILKVKEIIGMMPVTYVPRAPDFVKGLINLRGRVIPVIDLRLRFDLEAADYTDRTCIVVLETERKSENHEVAKVLIGVIVDSVSEVLNIKGTDVEDTPAFGIELRMDYILGMAKVEGKVKILLNIDSVFDIGDISVLEIEN